MWSRGLLRREGNGQIANGKGPKEGRGSSPRRTRRTQSEPCLQAPEGRRAVATGGAKVASPANGTPRRRPQRNPWKACRLLTPAPEGQRWSGHKKRSNEAGGQWSRVQGAQRCQILAHQPVRQFPTPLVERLSCCNDGFIASITRPIPVQWLREPIGSASPRPDSAISWRKPPPCPP